MEENINNQELSSPVQEKQEHRDEVFNINDLASVQIGLADPKTIESWGFGEVTRAETLNYRSQKPEPDGLFCQKIFGPVKDYECLCGKYRKARYQGSTCEKCGVPIISKEYRRERMGYIKLNSPCCHIWYLKSIPSRIHLVLDISPKQLEDIIYFAAHVVLPFDADTKEEFATLKEKDYLSEATAREKFDEQLRQIRDKVVEKGSNEEEYVNDLIAKCANEKEPLDFITISNFITDKIGVKFGEGAEAIKLLLQNVKLDEEIRDVEEEIEKTKSAQDKLQKAKRLEVLHAFKSSGQKPEWMILDTLPVIPPDLRPMLQLDGGRFAASDLNDLYRRVIHRNNRVKRLTDMGAPNVILMNEKRMLQEAVDALIDNGRRAKPVTGPSGRPFKSLSSGLKGKQGRFRQNLLGKRVDYSGRSVIAVGPDLRMYQCGLPREMAVQLLKPFIASILIKEKYVTSHNAAIKFIDRYDPIVLDIVERIISDHPVLLNRAPTLHRLSIQAFQPKLVDGRAIRLHPLVCTGFNADFDGDQMAVHVPLSRAAQKEAVELMLASNNILGPKDGSAIVIPGQDMILGNYHLTTEETRQDFSARIADLKALLEKHKENKVASSEERDINEMIKINETFRDAEGRVFRSVNEVRVAYESGLVSLHNRIAIKADVVHKDFGEVVGGKVVSGLPLSVKGKYLITSVGKIIFNDIFPDTFPYVNDKPTDDAKIIESWFVTPEEVAAKLGKSLKDNSSPLAQYIASLPVHEPIGKKQLGPLIDMVFDKFGTSKTSAVLDKIKDQGFKYSMISSVTVAISDINDVTNKEAIVKTGEREVEKIEGYYEKGFVTLEERHKQIVKIWKDKTEQVKSLVDKQMKADKRNPLVIMANSGSRGSVDNFKQLIGMKGLVANPKNEEIELPIVSSYRSGLKVSEFFINTHGARKGAADTALKTSDSGYLTRRLVDVSQDVIVREEDCHCDHGFKVREIVDTARDNVIVPLEKRLAGRYAMHDILDPVSNEKIVEGNTMISDEQAKAIVKAGIKEVEIRSIFTCQTKDGVCRRCYGRNMATGKEVNLGDAVGIMAAQSIGEPGTQLTMRVFHTGGMAGSDITTGLPRVQELVEARNPKGEATIARIAGEVIKIDSSEPKTKITIKNDTEEMEHDCGYTPRIRVKLHDQVEAGAKLTEGAVNPRELIKYGGIEKLEVYILKEIQKVYAAQSIGIADKHLEIIIRQMVNRVLVVDGGDTGLLHGSRVSLDKFTSVNAEALLNGKRPATCEPLVLGITRAALETDSFLSAASFQETTRVLTDAAIKAKKDELHGLKENVITGRLIPAGTGFNGNNPEEVEGWTVAEAMKKVKHQYIEKHDRQEDED